MTTINEYRDTLLASIDARAAHESSKNTENDSIQSCIKKIRSSLIHDSVIDVAIACNVDADFINRAERSNARYNVYAAEKVANILRTIAKCATLNHYTLAIVKTALALENTENVLTHKDAAAACSQDAKHADAKREKIIKSTRYAKIVSASTVSTQSSSSINALQTCNVLTEEKDASNVTCYRVNRESALVKMLQE